MSALSVGLQWEKRKRRRSREVACAVIVSFCPSFTDKMMRAIYKPQKDVSSLTAVFQSSFLNTILLVKALPPYARSAPEDTAL